MESNILSNPFPGLRPFEPDEDHLFFGREEEIDELLRRLRTTRFLLVVGSSGTGKSSLLASLKTELRKRAYYWPTTDRLSFQFTGGVDPVDVEGDDEDDVVVVAQSMDQKLGFSSGERQLKSLQEIVESTDAEIYLLDEWDANLDAANKAKADALVDALAARARVVEISHRDRAA